MRRLCEVIPGDLQSVSFHLHGGLLLQRVNSVMDVKHIHLRLSRELPWEGGANISS